MIPRIIQGSAAFFVAAFIASFGSSFVTADEPNGSAIAKDPCALTLLPHEGTDKEDLEIIRLQTRVRNASDSTAWLEELGWAFVAKARISFDPGFYKRAEQCALCLDGKKPDCAEALLLRAHVLNNLHKFKEAEAAARELVELMSWAAGVSNPRDPESAAWTSVRLARYKWQAGDTKRAL